MIIIFLSYILHKPLILNYFGKLRGKSLGQFIFCFNESNSNTLFLWNLKYSSIIKTNISICIEITYVHMVIFE